MLGFLCIRKRLPCPRRSGGRPPPFGCRGQGPRARLPAARGSLFGQRSPSPGLEGKEVISESFKASDSGRALYCYRFPAIDAFFSISRLIFHLLSTSPQDKPSRPLSSPRLTAQVFSKLTWFLQVGTSSSPVSDPHEGDVKWETGNRELASLQ